MKKLHEIFKDEHKLESYLESIFKEQNLCFTYFEYDCGDEIFLLSNPETCKAGFCRVTYFDGTMWIYVYTKDGLIEKMITTKNKGEW